MEIIIKEIISINFFWRYYFKIRYLIVNMLFIDVILVKKYGKFFFLYINEIILGCVE